MSTLERAIGIAADAHAGQSDKAGGPYILHPIRVMLKLGATEDRIVGVLHDVVEKSPAWNLSALRKQGFSEEVLAAIDAVTRREGEDYEVFVRRAGQNEMGRRVKLADVADNMDSMRLKRPSPEADKQMAKYRKALDVLLG
jgi:(p)ppGpp synthase/HD superfamily hydrolase